MSKILHTQRVTFYAIMGLDMTPPRPPCCLSLFPCVVVPLHDDALPEGDLEHGAAGVGEDGQPGVVRELDVQDGGAQRVRVVAQGLEQLALCTEIRN